jgi:hypothetical protein
MARAALDATDARKRWRARNEAKDRAHRLVEFYVRRLRRAGLPKPSCAQCGAAERTQAHHHDYDRPLDVTWLCPTCHISGHWANGWRVQRAAARLAVA